MRPRRISAGGVLAWREALRSLRENVRALLLFVGIVAVVAIITNLLPGSAWAGGFGTGFLFALTLAFAWWLAWVPSGLANRSNGLLAERWTTDLLRGQPGVHAVIPSLKFKGKDVDHVVVASSGIVAVETKWRGSTPRHDDLQEAAHQAADAGRTLRLSLRRQALPEHVFSTALVVWGPGADDLEQSEIQTPFGLVSVLPGHTPDAWLRSLQTGAVGEDYAATLRDELSALAVQRDREAIEAGTLLRWLARIR